ncbi:MAG: hypothetical protein ACI88H_002800 [Cocleimonas sp.]|jgi:hypothetical protein
MNKKTLLASTLLVAMSSFVTTTSFATSHDKMTEEAEVECLTQEELAEMTEDEKAEQALPLCEVMESEEAPKAE